MPLLQHESRRSVSSTSYTRTDQRWQLFEQSFLELRTENETLEGLVDGLFDQLDQLRQKLAESTTALRNSESRIAELEAVASEAGSLAESETAAALIEANRQCEELEHRVGDLEAALRENEGLLMQAKREISRLESSIGAAGAAPSDWQQERQELQVELDQVRARTAELEYQLHEKQESEAVPAAVSGGDVNLMAEEIRQLRRLVEKGPAEFAEPRVDAPPTAPAPPVHDPVVDSVMAQFAKLQKDVAARRRRASG